MGASDPAHGPDGGIFGQHIGAVYTECARARVLLNRVSGAAADAAQPRQRRRSRLGEAALAQRFDPVNALDQIVQQARSSARWVRRGTSFGSAIGKRAAGRRSRP
jgi:hypothetical protein